VLPLAATLALALAPAPGSVELGADTWRGLHTAELARPTTAELAVPAWASARTVQLTAVPGGVVVRATWVLRSLSRGAWFSGQVLGAIPGLRVEHVAWDGAPAATKTTPDGVTVAGRVTGTAKLELVAFVPGEPTRDALQLNLLPAVRGHVTVTAPEGLVAVLRATVPAGPRPAPELLVDVTADTVSPPPNGPPNSDSEHSPPAPDTAPPNEGSKHSQPVPPPNDISTPPEPTDALPIRGEFWTGAARLDLSFAAAPTSPATRATVVVARAGLGLTVGDAELRGKARLVWEVRQGTIDAVDFTATGTGADLEIKGTGVRAVQRSGDGVHVELQAPVAGRLELALTWTVPVAKTAESRAPLPQVTFTDVFRSEAALQLARDGEVEAVPDLAGWTPTTAAALPAWGQGLVEGTPTAAYRAGTGPGGALDLLRFVPIEGPPVVVDVAAYTIATSREGRALIRAHYEVRNERAATLRVRPPPGFEVLGVRVGGATATPARDRDGAWRIPLQRSVETVSGLLSFPVEIGFLGGADPWDRRERRALPLPRLDAPIAVARATLHLPPGYRSRHKPGDGDVVAAFTRGDGITYGLGVGAVGAAEADAVFQSAVKNWLANDFDAAQADLDKLRSIGASNENIARLQGNLDVIAGRGDRDDKGVQRRIREQARARSIADQQLQDELRTRAEEARKSGDYEAAQTQYRAAIAVGDRLAKLEQKESVEQQSTNQSIAFELESTTGELAARKRRSKSGGKQSASAPVFRTGKGSSAPPKDEPPPPPAGEPDPFQVEDDRDADGTPSSGSEGAAVRKTPAAAYNFADDDIDAADVKPTGTTITRDSAANLPVPAGRDYTAVLDTGDTAADPAPAQTFDAGGQASARAEKPVAIAGTTSSENQYIVDGAATKTPDVTKKTAQSTPTTPPPPTGRTFTAIAEAVPGTTSSAPGAVAEDTPLKADSASISVVQRQRFPSVRGRLANAARDTARRARRVFKRSSNAASTPDKLEPPRELEQTTTDALPEPKVTASAVSVVVPQLGQAVLYQRLLLPADAPHAIDVSAREPLIAKD
jgi:hypothetical protein